MAAEAIHTSSPARRRDRKGLLATASGSLGAVFLLLVLTMAVVETASSATAPPAPATTTVTPAEAAASPTAQPATPATTASTPGNCSGTTPPIAPPSGTWTCTLDDEFNGTSIDPSLWQPQLTAGSGYTTGSTGANRVCYVDNPQTISESGGTLNLSVVRLARNAYCKGLGGLGSGSRYEGGMITSYKLFSQQYGYFEASAEMPATALRGLQETLWLFPEDQTKYGKNGDSGEIDYAEFYSNYSNSDFPVVHYPGSKNDPNAQTPAGCTSAGTSPAGHFNTYALSWTPTTITAYFNGVPCITDVYAPYVTYPDVAPEPFTQPFFLCFTAALGLTTNSVESYTPMPATTKVDWVRVWQYS
jgi:beta-glucanase (GH16 family)